MSETGRCIPYMMREELCRNAVLNFQKGASTMKCSHRFGNSSGQNYGSGTINNEEATRTAIPKFAVGIGDTNPLWTDLDHASKTRYGTIVAPPS
jgi:hypothetical protein